MSPSSRPNLLLITTDQQRADSLGAYGNQVCRTPALDRLARDGVTLDRAYVANPICMPSRASLLTGLLPHRHGVWANGVPLPEGTRTLAHDLGDAGYRTALIGKAHLSPHGGRTSLEGAQRWREEEDRFRSWHGPYFGFEYVELGLRHSMADGHYGFWLRDLDSGAAELCGLAGAEPSPTGAPDSGRSRLPVGCHQSTWVAERSVAYLEERAKAGEPFFLWASFFDPHHPFIPPLSYARRVDPSGVPLPVRLEGELEARPGHFRERFRGVGPDLEGGKFGNLERLTEAQVREIIAHYYAMIELIDDSVNSILAALERSGLARDTIVVFTSDHGELLGDHGLLGKGPFHYEGLIRIPCIWRWPEGLPAGGRSGGLISLVDFPPTALDLLGVSNSTRHQGTSRADLLRGDGGAGARAVVVEFDSQFQDLRARTIVTDRWKLTAYPGQSCGELLDLEGDPLEFHNLWGEASSRSVQDWLTSELLEILTASDRRLLGLPEGRW